MSLAKSKPETTVKSSRRKSQDAVSETLVTALDNIQIRYAAYSQLFVGDINCRRIPHTDEEIRGYASSISAVGLLNNLIVVACDDGRLDVVAGGGRLKAIGLLVDEGKVNPEDPWIAYKVIPRELARAVSLTENGKRKEMHPSEQIAGFRGLVDEGKTLAQIADLLGYSSRHVQRMLKLAELAPAILEALAQDTITTEHCQALALENDTDRQMQVYEAASRQSWNGKPEVRVIRAIITDSEVSTDCDKFRFAGKDAFSPHEIRTDLFSDEQGGYVDALALDTAVLEKLQIIAEGICEAEGWAWNSARMNAVSSYGDDAKSYRMQVPLEAALTPDERLRIDELQMMDDETGNDAVEAEIASIKCAAKIRGWTAEQKAECGVVVSWHYGEIRVQRGMMKCEQEDIEEQKIRQLSQRDPENTVSASLLTKMSSERTLAVQAALMQQPERAIPLLAWTLCSGIFAGGTYSNPFKINLECGHAALTASAPTGKNGIAWQALMAEHTRLAALLPEGWERDCTTFFSLPDSDLLSLLSLCTAFSLNGVQNCTGRSTLDALETAIGFHLRDWWHPTKENFFSHMPKSQIAAALSDAELPDAACEVVKMKKGDAAEHAESLMAGNRWVPGWMKSPDSTAKEEETGAEMAGTG
ncbi:ParB/RepB/Spo0J family partition protein [Pantoea cypripedii]|uniref:Uncharacterized protein YubM n=1 Tax=Pantoea cypripedii TaxID=55209 RepID=A0A6B9G7Q0_PANCY|nr:ParB/RepB/Spo0J family partition protein [Pantoea cypripedii]QGY33178.1 chromosome partitioning protein ParB [Pantoea cypripedii]